MRADAETEQVVCLEIEPRDRGLLGALRDALGGPGAPAGVLRCSAGPRCIRLEFDPRRTPLSFIIDLIDVTLESSAGRTIALRSKLDDATLCLLAGDLLGLTDLEPSRILETHVHQ